MSNVTYMAQVKSCERCAYCFAGSCASPDVSIFDTIKARADVNECGPDGKYWEDEE